MNSKFGASLLVAGLFLVPIGLSATQNAGVVMSSDSVRIHPGKCACGFGLDWYLHVSSSYTEDPLQANQELAPRTQPADYTHWSWLILEDPSMYSSVTALELNVPSGIDANADGRPDFFQSSEAFQASSTGVYYSDWGGTVTALWTRNANSSVGGLEVTLNDAILGPLGPFRHSFEILERGGSLAYTPGVEIVSGTLTVSDTGVPGTPMGGQVQFTKSPADRFNVLTLSAGSWTNSIGGEVVFDEATFKRDLTRPKEYRGALRMGAVFGSWSVVITDPNDSNGNGIPDLSDDPQPPRSPGLTLAVDGGSLRLTIRGEAGRTNLIQEASSLALKDWQTAKTVVLTSGEQSVSLPLPASGTKFWRVQVQ